MDRLPASVEGNIAWDDELHAFVLIGHLHIADGTRMGYTTLCYIRLPDEDGDLIERQPEHIQAMLRSLQEHPVEKDSEE